MALDPNGILLSSDRSYLKGTASAVTGVRTATFDIVGTITRPPTTFTRAVAVAAGSPREEETTRDIPVRVGVYPRETEVESAQLEVLNGQLLAMGPVPLAVDAGRGVLTVARGFRRLLGAATTAVFSFLTKDGRQIRTPPQPIPIGLLQVRLDSNNDTRMGKAGSPEDRADEQAAAEGQAFVFWEGDAKAREDRTLVDYARLSVRRQVMLDKNTRVAVRIAGGQWELRRRVDVDGFFAGQMPTGCDEDGKLQFCNVQGYKQQMVLLNVEDPRYVPQKLGEGVIEIPHTLLRGEENEFLFRCIDDTEASRACPAGSLEVGEILPTGEFGKVSEASVRILPFKDLASMITLRQDASLDKSITPSWTAPHYKVAATASEVPGWSSLKDKAATAKQVTLIVHGYAVGQEEFADGLDNIKCVHPTNPQGLPLPPVCDDGNPVPGEFSLMAKRLYWAGHPILEAQGQSRVVGVSWPGDLPGKINPFVQFILPTDEVRPFYTEDEFNALLAGVPLEKELTSLRRGAPDGRRISILAHSLGNMVVNNALTRMIQDERSAGIGAEQVAPINYVMYQAAVTNEAFLGTYDPLAFRNSLGITDLVRHAQDLGFPDPDRGKPDPDWLWVEQESEVFRRIDTYACPQDGSSKAPPEPEWCQTPPVSELPTPPEPCQLARCEPVGRFFRGFQAVGTVGNVVTGWNPAPSDPKDPSRLSYFNNRWRQFDQEGVIQGAWTQTFRPNVNPQSPPAAIKLFNAYNPGDFVLRIDQPYNEALGPAETLLKSLGPPPWSVEAAASIWKMMRAGRHYHAWKAAQILSKPFAPGSEALVNRLADWIHLGGARDDLAEQKWWTLEIDGRPVVWQTTETGANEQQDVGVDPATARRWAALALWYPALAPPAGSAPVEALQDVAIAGRTSGTIEGLPHAGGNVNMSAIGGEDGPGSAGTASHSYMQMKKLHEVWKGFRAFRRLLAE